MPLEEKKDTQKSDTQTLALSNGLGNKDVLEQTTVTIVKDKEEAAILHVSTVKMIALAFSLQETYDNASAYQKEALYDASVSFLKVQCQRVIAQWDNLVTKASKTQKYALMNRKQVEDALAIHPKCKAVFDNMNKAVKIKKSLA